MNGDTCTAYVVAHKRQCSNESNEHTEYCDIHDRFNKSEKEGKRLYQLHKWQRRIQEFDNSDKVKSVRDELAILRMSLETILNACNTAADIMIRSAQIAKLVDQINTLVVSTHKIEKSLGLVVDKDQLVGFAMRILTVITTYVSNPDTLELIAEGIKGVLEHEEE